MSKTKSNLRHKLFATSVLAAMMSAVPLAGLHAQEVERVSQAEEDDVSVQDTVRVTGTRLNTNPNLNAANPILSVGQQEIDSRGNIRIEDLTNILPQVFAGQAGEVSNGASGTATLNLRGLGAVRTLTLVDGKRLPYGSSTTSAPNIDLIPAQLVERVDLLTGGASAVYGSDAVAGVANFILRDNFEGVEFEIQGAINQNGNGVDFFDSVLAAADQPIPGGSVDGEELFVSGLLGSNFDNGRGNVTLFGSYEIRNEITQDDRSISACALDDDDGPQSFGGFGCVGSANFRLFGGPGGFTFQELDGNIIPFAGGPAQTFNFGPFNFFQRPSERFQIYARGHYDITDNLEVFADLSFTDNSSDAQIAPTASFGIGAFSINCDNPLIQGNTGEAFTDIFGCSAADIAAGTVVDGITASHRNVEGGPRNSSLDNNAFRFVSGFRGNVDIWEYEVFGQFARTNDISTSTNDFVTANVQQAFLATTDVDGNIVCTDTSGGCVPFNIFQRGPNGETLVTQDQLDFIQGVGITTGETQQIVLGANIQADLGNYGIKSPFTDAGIGILFGYEFREEELEATPDEISQIEGGGFTGVGGSTLPVSGEVDVNEFYLEAQVPLVADLPFFKELTFNAQYRFSAYDVAGVNPFLAVTDPDIFASIQASVGPENDITLADVNNDFDTSAFGFQLAWTPIDDISLRAQFQRAVRAPNVIELFTGVNTGLPNLANGDPCATATPTATLAQCMNTGVTAAQFGTILDVISNQTQSITSGNPFLEPESSDTFTVGAVYTPSFVPNLRLSVDYFNIDVDDFISQVPAQTALDNCLASGDPFFCGLIERDSAGSLNAGTFGVGFTQTLFNISALQTSGVDFQILYGFDLEDIGVGGWGDIQFDYASTVLTEFDFTPVEGNDVTECAGAFGTACLQPVNPTYRHRLLATWNTPWNVSLTNTWRYFSSTDNEVDNPLAIDETIGTEQYWDISANYDFNEHLSLRFGVNNLLNNQAPVSISSGPPLGNGNTFPTIFDTGRFIFLGATVNF